jgi:hypothetical protein
VRARYGDDLLPDEWLDLFEVWLERHLADLSKKRAEAAAWIAAFVEESAKTRPPADPYRCPCFFRGVPRWSGFTRSTSTSPDWIARRWKGPARDLTCKAQGAYHAPRAGHCPQAQPARARRYRRAHLPYCLQREPAPRPKSMTPPPATIRPRMGSRIPGCAWRFAW